MSSHKYLHEVLIIAVVAQLFLSLVNCQRVPTNCSSPPSSCPPTYPYRSYDGSCNNLLNPGWGMPVTAYNRLLPATYPTNSSTPTKARSGNDLPNARKVSTTVYPDIQIIDYFWTLLAMQYGQFLVHDMSMIATDIVPQTDACCSDAGQILNNSTDPNECFSILVPEDDPVYSELNVSCLPFVRTKTERDLGCDAEGVQQLTIVNGWVDLSLVYGLNDNVNTQIRLFNGGKLKSEVRNGQEWLPRNPIPVCRFVDPSEPCYLAGDTRVNQNPQLTVIHTVFLREHNRIAIRLAQLNPLWNDEKLFQIARKILIAKHQNIAYNEWLPIFLGDANSVAKKLIYKTSGYVNDYNSAINPSILNEQANAASRFFHTLIAGTLDLVPELRISHEHIRFSDWTVRPAILERNNSNFDKLCRGLTTQPEMAADVYHDKEITQNWLRPIGGNVGQDLKAICVQRNRDHGLRSYNDYRVRCGLPRATSWTGFQDTISSSNIQKLQRLYEIPDDVDLTVGGSLEKLVPGTLAGKTFLCIMTEQFLRTRTSDRFFFEHSGSTGFTLPQLNSIRKSSISKLFCDNTDIQLMQSYGFRQIGLFNPLLLCSLLPAVDLSLWKDPPSSG